MSLQIFVSYKIYSLKEKLIKTKYDLQKLKTWWTIYTYLLAGLVTFYFLTRQTKWIQTAIISFMMLASISTILDYRSGRHIFWHRQKLKKEYQDKKHAEQGEKEWSSKKEDQ